MGTYREIYVVGNREGVDNLRKRTIEKVADLCGVDSVAIERRGGSEVYVIRWLPGSREFVMAVGEKSGLNIFAPDDDTDEPAIAQWNANLETFYREIIEPIADRAGDVKAFLAFKEDRVEERPG